MRKSNPKKSNFGRRPVSVTQLTFGGSDFIKPSGEFGGALLKGNPKTKRPIDSSLPIHLTLRATKSVLRLPRTHKSVNDLVGRVSRKYGVRIYKFANVGNHCHLLLKVPRSRVWAPFIRELTGRIAQTLMDLGIQIRRFWAFRPHTRVISGWTRAYRSVLHYIHLNQLEADGLISRRQILGLKNLSLVWSSG